MGDTIVEESHSRETYDNVELESSATVNSVDGAAINDDNDDEYNMENAVSIECNAIHISWTILIGIVVWSCAFGKDIFVQYVKGKPNISKCEVFFQGRFRFSDELQQFWLLLKSLIKLNTIMGGW